MTFTQLHSLSHYSFLKSASSPEELVAQAYELHYQAIAITDECSLAGIVKAHMCAKTLGIQLLVGSQIRLSNGALLIVLAPNKTAYSELSWFITLARRRAPKGEYQAHFDDLRFRLKHCLIIWLVQFGEYHITEDTRSIPFTDDFSGTFTKTFAKQLHQTFKQRLWVGINHQWHGHEQQNFARWQGLAQPYSIPLVACNHIAMHDKQHKTLHDTLTAIHHNTTVMNLGQKIDSNAEAYLKSPEQLKALYPEELLHQTEVISQLCHFSMDELLYQYPQELVPKDTNPTAYLTQLVQTGAAKRWP